ncbi:MAG TPA: PilZ domain-containing protein [Myxococcaceae bacterium]|nr:PilZ domain-containing protein [Myxococcaceae bacterium]
MPGPERRHPRIRCNARIQGSGMSKSFSGRVRDLSGTGLFLETRQFIPVGRQVYLEFELRTGPVEVMGEVRWLARGPEQPEQGMGIRFLRMSAASARAVDEALR